MAYAGSVEFKAARGARFTDEDAQEIGEFLNANGMMDGDEPIDADEVVKLAKPKSSPLHKHIFGLSQAQAAAEWRREQARYIVRHIVVVVDDNEDDDEQQVTTRAFHHVATKEGKEGYVSERVVWSRPDYAEQVVAKALRELTAWRKRYAQYSEFSGVVKAIDKLVLKREQRKQDGKGGGKGKRAA